MNEDAEAYDKGVQRLEFTRAGVYARLRFTDLKANDRTPLHSDAAKDLEPHSFTRANDEGAYTKEVARLERDYRTERDAAEGVARARDAFIAERLSAGRHPDTDPAFWRGWNEPASPTVTKLATRRIANPSKGAAKRGLTAALALVAGIAALFLAVVALMVARLLRRRLKPRR